MKIYKSILVMILLALPSSAFAADGMTASLSLKGSVSATNELYITANGSNNLTLDVVNGENGKNVAYALEKSNSPSGYKITASSQNSGFLVHSVNGVPVTNYGTPRAVAYQLNYDSAGYVTLDNAGKVMKTVPSLTGYSTYKSQILVNVSGKTDLPAGDFYDSVTFTIAKN